MRSTIKIWLSILLISACQSKVTISTPQDPNGEVEEEVLPDWVDQDYISGMFSPEKHPDFIAISPTWTPKKDIYLRKEAYRDFIKMAEAAKADGVHLQILSATRNFQYQKGIWERKWDGITTLQGGIKATDLTNPIDRAKKILLYSSMPGTSRHHWGTDIDINSFNNKYFEKDDGAKVYQWLRTHAHHYGYCQPYTNKVNGRTGYEEEKWHWTYRPISDLLTKYAELHMQDSQITGFKGSGTATDIGMKSNYVLGIAPQCIN